MRRLAWALILLSCGGGGDDAGPPGSTACASDIDCADTATCRSGRCVKDGSLTAGDVCTKARQCADGLSCDNQVCTGGCSPYYDTESCDDHAWCKPLTGGQAACAAPECGPETSATCVGGNSCVMLDTHTGVCLQSCLYGFVTDTYHDDCTDGGGVDLSCQAVGAAMSPVCLVTGPDALAVGEPGCSPIDHPCVAGLVCVDVVCRKLCRTSQSEPCPVGEQCLPLVEGGEMYTCQVP